MMHREGYREDPWTDLGYSSHDEEMARRADRESLEAEELAPPESVVVRQIGGAAARSARLRRRRSSIDADYACERDVGVDDPYPSPDRLGRTVSTNRAAVDEMLLYMQLERIRTNGVKNGDPVSLTSARLRAAQEAASRGATPRHLVDIPNPPEAEPGY